MSLVFFRASRTVSSEIESPGDEAMTVSPPSPPGAIDAPVPPQTPTPTWSGNFWKRSQLTGDWFGSRRRLAEDGLSFFGDLTQYYQGVTTGGRAQRFAYGGRGDYLL
ncbi:MAG TPA: hypothetical protein VLM40_00230, partial [Gemmata sp.]|nr:hypothetical protein [Gemmata sp.]